jgi:hypothetical protein
MAALSSAWCKMSSNPPPIASGPPPTSQTAGWNPSPPRTVPSPKLTLDQMKEIVLFFKDLFEGSKLGWAIIAAGVAGGLEILRIGWLVIRYVFRF